MIFLKKFFSEFTKHNKQLENNTKKNGGNSCDIKANILGVYTVPHTDKKDRVKLIEIFAECPPHHVNVNYFTQIEPDVPRENWQAPYDEHYLNESGTQIIGDFSKIPSGTSFTRLAFFIHFVDLKKPLSSQFGILTFPAESPMPKRLKNIINFTEAD